MERLETGQMGRLKIYQPVPTFYEFSKSLCEACSRGAINNVVVEADCDAQIFAVLNLSIHKRRLFGDAAQRHLKRVI